MAVSRGFVPIIRAALPYFKKNYENWHFNSNNGSIYGAVFADCKRAFDVDHNMLSSKLKTMKVSINIVDLTLSLLFYPTDTESYISIIVFPNPYGFASM